MTARDDASRPDRPSRLAAGGGPIAHSRRRTLRQRLQHFINTKIWAMDIHPSARIAATALIDRTWPRGIHIADRRMIGEEAVVPTHDLTRGIYHDTRIGARTLVGARAILLPGVTVGADCVIEPGALVRADVPAGHVTRGNPATIAPRNG